MRAMIAAISSGGKKRMKGVMSGSCRSGGACACSTSNVWSCPMP
jgi:hypothetical protein